MRVYSKNTSCVKGRSYCPRCSAATEPQHRADLFCFTPGRGGRKRVALLPSIGLVRYRLN